MTTPILQIPEVANNQVDQYLTVNDALRFLESAANDFLSVNLSSGNITLTSAQFTRSFVFVATGNTVSRNLTVPANKRFFAVVNSGSFPLNVVRGSSSVVVLDGEALILFSDGTTNGLVGITKTNRSDLTLIADSTTARTLLLSDSGKYLRFTNAAAVTVTVPADSSVPFLVGSQVHIRQAGLGAVSFSAAGGVTINAPASGSLDLAGQGAAVTLIKVAANEWDLMGQVAAV